MVVKRIEYLLISLNGVDVLQATYGGKSCLTERLPTSYTPFMGVKMSPTRLPATARPYKVLSPTLQCFQGETASQPITSQIEDVVLISIAKLFAFVRVIGNCLDCKSLHECCNHRHHENENHIAYYPPCCSHLQIKVRCT